MTINMSVGKKAHPDLVLEYSLEDIDQYALEIVNQLPLKGEVYLEGEMGAGKTSLIKTILRILGVKDTISSPTFSLVNSYELPNHKSIFHADLYRVENEEELYDIGFDEYLEANSLIFIEWSERMTSLFNPKAMKITIEITSQYRRKLSIYRS
jgi:tRNA threonylcarbamoyladenosine biosynthesis protein TsaE